jgi:hypothetical protein
LSTRRSLWRFLPNMVLFASIAAAQSSVPLESLLNLAVPAPPLAILPPPPPLPPCSVAPLAAITDADALAFENGSGPDVGGLQPAITRALERFRQLVTSVGGSFELKSAYRPPAYQAHLQQVWFQWMALRNNREPGCQELRAAAGDEFARHHLLETQKPVNSSDHTRGLAFDATVTVPVAARLKRRRVSLDRLALLAGIRRPDIFHDPVHFKLAAARVNRHV